MNRSNFIFGICFGCLTLSIFAWWYYAHPSSPFFKKVSYTLIADEVGALKEGDQVTVNGTPQGKVKLIQLFNNNQVLLKISINQKVQISKDARVRIISTGLTGDRVIDIDQGSSLENFSTKDTLLAHFDAGANRLVMNAREVFLGLNHLFGTLSITIDSTISHPRTQKSLEQIQYQFRKIKTHSQSLTQNNLKELKQLDLSVQNIRLEIDSLENLVQPSTDSLKTNIKTLQSNWQQTQKILDQIKLNIEKLQKQYETQENTIKELYTSAEFKKDVQTVYKSYIDLFNVIRTQQLRTNVDIF